MNFSDSEIVDLFSYENGYNTTQNLEDADLVLVNHFILFVIKRSKQFLQAFRKIQRGKEKIQP